MTQNGKDAPERSVAVVDSTQNAVEETVSSTDIIPQSSGFGNLVEGLRMHSPDVEGIPIHEQYLEALDDENVQELVSGLYYGLSQRLKGSKFVGKEIQLYGLAIYEHGPYQGKDGFYHPEGYYQILLLTVDPDAKGEPFVVLRTSATAIAFHAARMVKKYGWFVFPDGPKSYQIVSGENGDLHLYNVEHNQELKKRLGLVPAAK